MRWLALWRVTAVRFAAIYTLIFAVLMGLGLVAVYLGTIGVIERQREVTINSEIRGLAERFDSGGLRELVRAVDDRAGPDASGDNVYLLTSPQRERLAGNLNGWPRNLEVEGWTEFSVTKRDGARVTQRQVRARGFLLPANYRLLVGRDSEDLQQFRSLFLRTVLWVAAGIVFLGGFIGLVLGRQILRRVDKAAEAGERIAEGNLDSRVPVSGSGDEFDRLAEAVNAMLDRIEGLMSGMRMATDSISHDVRRPLTRLRAQLEMALLRDGVSEETQDDMAGALAQVDTTVGILENLLRIARAEAGVPAESWREIDLAQLTEAAMELYEPFAEEKGVEVASDLAPARFRAEPQLLAQGIANLIDNAIKYAPDAGGKIDVACGEADGAYFVEVRDNGPGIPEADRERVTERFVRLDEARESEGSGLGLSLVRAVARAHGGKLVLGDAGPGLVVRIELPIEG